MKNLTLSLLFLSISMVLFAVKPTHNEITDQKVRWFEMKFKESKVPNSDKRLKKVYLLLGFRHHLDSSKESAYLSLYVLSDKGTVDWKKYMFLEGSSTLSEEASTRYKVETFKEEEALNIFQAMSQELYRLDLLEIHSPEDLVSFYQKNFQENRTYYLVLRDRMAIFPFALSQKNFELFFKHLAFPSEKDFLQKPKSLPQEIKTQLLHPYNLLKISVT